VALIILLVALGIVFAQETGGGYGDLHCYVGAIGAALIVLSLAGGFISSGRFGRTKHWKPRRFHYPVTVITAFYMTGEFVLGLVKINGAFPISPHSMIGVSIPLLSWLTVLLSPCLAGKLIPWKVSSKIHVVLSLLLLLMVIIQVLYAYLIMGG